MQHDHVVLAPTGGSEGMPLTSSLRTALVDGDFAALDSIAVAGFADRMGALLTIYDLWLGTFLAQDGKERFQNHPAVSALKWKLEDEFLASLTRLAPADPVESMDAVAAIRRIARQDDAHVYDWLATSATWEQLVEFLAIEGGPDGGFDDLVAICQVGVQGGPKVVFGANYWDEMGRGDVEQVHTHLHNRLVEAVGLRRVPWDELPVSALERSALNGLLATNRWLQPELVGALGLLELQAGPRCRRVVRALRRLDAPADALPFYEEHAETDPRHGKAWLDDAIAPLVEERAEWGPRIVRGARWRAALNQRLFADVHERLTASTAASA